MALIVEYHVVADQYPVGASAITAGMVVAIANDLVVPAPTGTDPDQDAIGIAGDSALSSEGQTTAYSDEVYIGADGGTTKYTSNRVSDFYDETAASGKITVYNGGGKFWVSTDLFDAPANVSAGVALGVSGTTAGEWEENSITDDDIVAMAVGSSQAYPSGVPGTDVDGSLTLGNFIPMILRI